MLSIENLELLVAFLAFRGKLELASRVGHMLDMLQSGKIKRVIMESRQLGLSNREIRTLLWEARSNFALRRN